MAKRLRDVCSLPESEPLWRAGRGFVVHDWRSGVSAERRHLKKSGNVCGGLPTRRYGAGIVRAIPPFEFENWAVIALGDMMVLTIAQPFMAGFTV
jgi:hypothetical protein